MRKTILGIWFLVAMLFSPLFSQASMLNGAVSFWQGLEKQVIGVFAVKSGKTQLARATTTKIATVLCPQEVFRCPSGEFVSRIPADCEFRACARGVAKLKIETVANHPASAGKNPKIQLLDIRKIIP